VLEGDPLVVVVAFHGVEALATALDPLRDLDVVVVDNSSSELVSHACGVAGARYLDAGGNLGFARGVNLGLAEAAGRDVVLVNPDAVVDPAVVRSLARALHPSGRRVAAASPLLVGTDGAAQRVRWPFPSPRGAWAVASGRGERHDALGGFLVGAVLALNADALADVGGFDPSYFLYAEETDWQRRAVQQGWELQMVHELVARHAGGGTSSDERRREVHFHAGTERYVRTWFGSRGWESYRAAAVLGAAARAAVLTGGRGAEARRRAALYLRGPLRQEQRRFAPRRSVVHVVLTNNFAGTERLVCTEAVGFAERGWDVTVIGGSPARMRAALGLKVHHVPAVSVADGVRALASVGRPDVVHAHLTAAELAAVLAKPRHRAPVIATRHIAARRGKSPAGRAAGWIIRRGLDHQIAISAFVSSMLGEPCVVVPNGVPDPGPSNEQRARTVLVLQRLEPEKHTAVAVRAWALSGLGAQGWRLQVAGDGVERARVEALVVELGVTGTVDLLGWRDDTADLVGRAGIFLATAAAEPFGLSVVEAMSHGTPVVAADGGAHREVLGGAGVLRRPDDVGGLAEALITLADDEQGRADRGDQLRARYLECFTVERHLDGVAAVYDMAMGIAGERGRRRSTGSST
jgi:GT2 family glycosyltransferase